MKKIKILLVDDEADFLEIMGTVIKNWGYDLIKAASGKLALDALLSEKPDIIVLDYMMPEMDGITTLKEIRKIDKCVPVIMFTAYPNAKTMSRAKSLGINAFIPKLSTHSDTEASLRSAVQIIAKKIEKRE